MKEGAWINQTGSYAWITEHASWIQIPANARRMGLPEAVIAKLVQMPWDFNGDGRWAILLAAMGGGLLRARGHGSSITFEFTVPNQEAIQAAVPFLTDVAGPHTFCSFTNLETQGSVGFNWKDHPKSRS